MNPYESLPGVPSKQKEALMRAQELSASAQTDVKTLREEIRREEERNTAEYEKKAPRLPREITGRELGAKVELMAAETAANLLSVAENSIGKERPFGRGYVHKEVLLDIGGGKVTPGKLDSIVMGQEDTRGLRDYFEEGMKLGEHTLQYPKNPAIAMRILPYLYAQRRKMTNTRYERVVERTLSKLKKGESVRDATDLDHVYVEYARAMVPKEHSDYSEERLQMSVVVDYPEK